MGASFRVGPAELSHRLDATYFSPEFVENEARLLRCEVPCEPLSEVVSAGRRAIFQTTVTQEAAPAPSTWRPFITSDDFDVNGFFVEQRTRLRVPPDYLDVYPRARLRDLELLVKVKGPNQLAAFVERAHDGVLVSGTVWGALVSRRVDPYYLASVLQSPYGDTARRRRRTNVNVEFVAPDDLVTVPIPLPDRSAQSYIGLKVRHAGTLRAWAHMAETSFCSAVGVVVPDATAPGRQSRVPPADLDADLNPGRFTPDRLEVRRALARNGARLVESFATVAAENTASPAARSRYLGLDGISSTSIDVTLQSVESAEVSGTCRVLPRGAAISKLRPYLNKAVFVPGGVGPIVGSTELLCVRSHSVHPGFVYGVLKLDTTVRQLNPVASGATHPRVGADEVLDLLVPWHDDHEWLGRSLERAQQAYFGARALVTAARLLVEALIEREVTEVELIAASKEPDADRALLSRLHEDGLDGKSDALFPDLDALAELIAEATRGSAT